MLYSAVLPETALREVLADLRPSAAAIGRYIKTLGPRSAGEVPSAPVTAAWRQRHVLAPARLELTGALVDLIDVPNRREIERRHLDLLLEHGLDHLDLHEVTTSRRAITQTIAAEFECGAAAVGFRHDWTAMPAPRGVKAAAL